MGKSCVWEKREKSKYDELEETEKAITKIRGLENHLIKIQTELTELKNELMVKRWTTKKE